jgi:hypothetical protein
MDRPRIWSSRSLNVIRGVPSARLLLCAVLSSLASKGAGQYEIGAVLGITDPGTIAVYTRGRDVDELAERGFARLNAR